MTRCRKEYCNWPPHGGSKIWPFKTAGRYYDLYVDLDTEAFNTYCKAHSAQILYHTLGRGWVEGIERKKLADKIYAKRVHRGRTMRRINTRNPHLKKGLR